MTLFSANELRLAYGHQTLLDGVTVAISAGEKVGLVGRNGCGKTSLLKILANENQADSGETSARRGLRIGYLPQEFELDPALSVYDNIAAGAADVATAVTRYENGDGSESELADLLTLIEHTDGWNLDARIKSLSNALFTPPLESETGPLSGGEKRRVALCSALASQPDLLLLDEPTNHLDSESIRWLEDFLKTYTGAVIFVTHDRYFLNVIATRIIEISDGKAYSHPGNYTAFLESKAARQEIAENTEKKRQKFLKDELKWVKAGVKARTTKSRSRLDAFYEVKDQDAPVREGEIDLLIPPPPRLGNTIVDLEDVSITLGDRTLFRSVNLSLEEGQCTGIVGKNGVGKSTLLKICLQQLEPTSGKAILGKQVKINYIDQSRMQLDGTGSLLDEISDGNEKIEFGAEILGARAYLRRFLFSDERINERVDLLSGGERARLMLAKVLKTGGNLIVLDEPTNDLDLQSLRMLEEALSAFPGTILVVSHDRYFLDRICDQIVAFEDDGVKVSPGNFSYYLEKRQARENAARAQATAANRAAKKRASEKKDKPRKLTMAEAKELETLEEKVMEADDAVTTLQEKLSSPEVQTNFEQIPVVMAELEAAKKVADGLINRWEFLEEVKANSPIK
ncbi:ABC-F family ATP-binding cassette domain-containing protein [Akkermansiaceae bacterium]|nr:ABC-F family ATP-binding cassette domain-containing protein [Akkermansiaceae bacterium]MDA7609938.1 ABC-F family ATP-binding cassette domain-containing protein [bacterium]MDA7608103.1 ABC-F family ATP-binding cassette domain-containing protein [Akkermansiaceae bacterium]MDA7617165.1 ABC-F family ATP-binding cassette domain-containing protein [Akkermansiaceae bacterium]MDA7623572.1 ABC-F family ATP-binding cassette domain-containing protein [Akkermansiaceae bacterium]